MALAPVAPFVYYLVDLQRGLSMATPREGDLCVAPVPIFDIRLLRNAFSASIAPNWTRRIKGATPSASRRLAGMRTKRIHQSKDLLVQALLGLACAWL